MKNLIVIALILVGMIGIWGYGSLIPSVYYTQIDNSKMTEINPAGGVFNLNGSLPYKYTLPCYDASGNEKKLSFTAGKKLRENAFIRLEKQPFRGVIRWCEVQYDELPANVQNNYADPAKKRG